MAKKPLNRVYIDVNIVVNLFLKNEELAFRSALLISLCKQRNIEVCTSVLSIAIADYLLDREMSTAKKKAAIEKLVEQFEIVPNLPQHVKRGLKSKRFDFEDEIHMQAAIDANCAYLVTEDRTFFNVGNEAVIVISTDSFLQYIQTL